MLTYKIPVAIYDSSEGKYITLTEALYMKKLDSLLKESGCSIQLDSSSNEFGFSLTVVSGNKFPMDKLVPLIPELSNPNSATGSILINTIGSLATKLKVSSSNLISVLKKLENERSIWEGKIAPPKRLPKPNNMFIDTLVSKINDKYYPVTVNSTTLKMETSESEIVLSLPHPDDVAFGQYSLPDLSALYEVPRELSTHKWREVAKSMGIPLEFVSGCDDNNKGGILPNEMSLKKQLVAILEACIKREYGDIDKDKYTNIRPKSFVEFMKNLLYVVLKHNWDHTIRVPTLLGMEALIEDSSDSDDYDDDDSSDGGSKQKDFMNLSDSVYDYPDPNSVEETIRKLKTLNIIMLDSRAIPEARYEVYDFISLLDSKKPDPHYYIEAFIKLLRWGERKISKLYIGEIDNIYLDLDTFQVKEEFNEENAEVMTVFGKAYVVHSAVVSTCYVSPTLKNAYLFGDNLQFVIPGIFCLKAMRSKTNPSQIDRKRYYLDALNVLDIYKKNKKEEFIHGIEYENGVFRAKDEDFDNFFKSRNSNAQQEQPHSIHTFIPILSDSEYSLPNVLLEDFFDKQVPNKKLELNLPNIFEQLSNLSIADVPSYIQSWLPKAAYILKSLSEIEPGKTKWDFISFLNALAKMDKLGTSPEDLLSSVVATNETYTEENTLSKNEEGTVEMSNRFTDDKPKETPKFELPVETISEGYRVLKPDGQLACYYDISTKRLVSSKSIVGTLRTDRKVTISSILKGYAEKAQGNDEIKALLHHLIDLL